MSEIMQLVEATFKPLVLVFVVANLLTLGLQAKMGDVLITYRFGFGLGQNQRSVMSLGMLTSNVSILMIVAIAIPDADPALLTYIIMYTIASIPFAAIAARIFGKQAGETVAGDTP